MRFLFVVFSACLALFSWGDATAGTLDRVKETGVLKLGYRVDAAPFSYEDASGRPAGYSIDLCAVVAAGVKTALGLSDLRAEFVAVGAEDRFAAIQNGEIDLLCGATTVTLSRRQLVDFSVLTFIDGASVLYRAGGPSDFEGLAGHKVGVRGGTTTETALQNTLTSLSVNAEVVSVSDHKDGLGRLEDGQLSAYFADQGILLYLMIGSSQRENLRLSKRFFTREPYALALPHGDDDFRLAVDRTLSRLYRSGQIMDVFGKHFGLAAPSQLLEALFVVSALPE